MLRLVLVLVVLVTACAGPARLSPQGGYTLTRGREHSLVGRVYSRMRRALTAKDELESAVGATSWLLLGETHDNPDHHRLQAQLLELWLATHPNGSVGFEMLDETQAPLLAPPLPTDADAFAARVRWADTGWPDFALYRPVFEVLLARGARIVAAHPSRERVRASMAGLTQHEQEVLSLLPPPEQRVLDAMAEEIREGHCGHAPEGMIEPMVNAQRFKDASMAYALLEAGAPSALVAGRGHVRDDRGVPAYLARRGVHDVVTVGFVDVFDDAREPEDYDEIAAFDFVVFTPRVTDESACDRFRRELSRMRR